jgi:hypothetical protein
VQPAAQGTNAPQSLEPYQLGQSPVHRPRLGPFARERHGLGDEGIVEMDVRPHVASIHLDRPGKVYRAGPDRRGSAAVAGG